MNKIKLNIGILVIMALSLSMLSCDDEDDTIEIFDGNSFKITGITMNGVKMVKEVSEFYESDNTYRIFFNSKTFQGTLAAGIPIEGTWTADGKKHSIQLNFSNKVNVENSSEVCRKTFNILKEATSYKGDKNVMRIKKGNDTYIEMRAVK